MIDPLLSMHETTPFVMAQQAGVVRQRLNAADRLMLAVNRALLKMGSAGFETQLLILLQGRADAARLRAALSRLGRLTPLFASRLIEDSARGGPYWESRPEAMCLLNEAGVDSGRQAVFAHASKLLSALVDLRDADPIRFHLLHRPDGKDVFLMQYNHALFDIRASVDVVHQLRRLFELEGGESIISRPSRQDLVRRYLRRFPSQRRRQAALASIDLWRHPLRGGAAMLSEAGGSAPSAQRCIVARQLNADDTCAIKSRILANCGLPGLSMAVLASAFRAFAQLLPPGQSADRNLIVGIGVDLPVGNEMPFQNRMSLVPIHALQRDLADRNTLLRALNRQMRDRLAADIDLGMLEMASLFGRRPRHAAWVIEHLLQYGCSFWYGFFGSLDAIGDSFCGTGIEDALYVGPSWPPVGLTVLANEFRGRLHLAATYSPSTVTAELARDLLDKLVADLIVA